ncbi:L,D-transpeptidase [Paenibacillus sp. J22TS3]|uniref:L,D-transpeptidase n=1 Tax=Paenibacillus sp. J22TS3 TaxID=2807192 RepID=UPI001B2D5DAE|nr:L,D-transpeptidase [Paenibacillus sp. J22TS3]GIP21245.1 hypothetical protein J22TS3_15200 [Paenibacillus sp. J22TS3]
MNPSYLKKYVEMHPGNKMAWYLLGKEYERSGQVGKANYCFNKAGHIYEAFESSKVPAEVWKEYEAKLLEASAQKERRSRRKRKLLLALMILLLMFIPSIDDPSIAENSMVAVDTSSIEEDYLTLPVQEVDNPSAPVKGPRAASLAFTAKAYGGGAGNKALGELIMGKGPQAQLTAVLGMRQHGKWLLWKRDMPVMFTVERDPASGRAAVQSYDAKSCECKPPDEGPLRKKANQWTKEQEASAVVTSAVEHFRQKNGRKPAKLGELVKPYPDNWIAGSSPELEAAFEQAVQEDHDPSGTGANGSSKGGSTKSAAGTDGRTRSNAHAGSKPFFNEPLEILVDKTSHRLALVSGNVILRSYKVGLGADRTPEGSYAITEKIVNPNGRSNGEFGSRGMQLSDTNYAIHGTNEPDSIGKDESLGCIRMSKEDVEELFDLAPKGTKVTIGKGIVPDLSADSEMRFVLQDRPDQTNPHRTYHWLF